MQESLNTLRLLISRKWLVPTLFVLLGMAFLARLGIWQLDRLEQRRERNAELRLALDAPPLELTGESMPDNVDNLKDRNVTVRGEYDFSQQVALKLQNWGGRTGLHLITPLRIAGSDSAVLIDRGWIPATESDDNNWSQYDETGPATVNGYIALSQGLDRSTTGNTGPVSRQREWYRVDIEAIEKQLPYELLPLYVSQAPSTADDAGPPYRAERDIDLSDGPHLGYAIQWFLFSLLLAAIYFTYVNKARQEALTNGE